MTQRDVGDLVWSKDPEELRKHNEGLVTKLGASKDVASKFFKNGWFTLTMQTRLVAALSSVNRPGCADYLQTASHADDEREALFFVESAEMLQHAHGKAPVARVLDDSQAVVALAGSKAVLLAPVDYVRSTDASREVLTEVAEAIDVQHGVLQAAERHAADVVVLGRRGRGGVIASLMGSSARAVAGRSPRPVLVVPEVPEDA